MIVIETQFTQILTNVPALPVWMEERVTIYLTASPVTVLVAMKELRVIQVSYI